MAGRSKAPPLRVVGDGEAAAAVPVPKQKQSVSSAAENGSPLELAIAMRDRIAKAVDDPKCPARDLAALTKRLDDLADKIVMLRAAERAERADEVDDEATDDRFDASAI